MRERRDQPEAWKRLAAIGVAAVAMLGVAACASAADPPAGGHQEPAAASSAATWYPAGQLPAASAGPADAPYFLTLAFQQAGAPATVMDAFTGRDLGVVHPTGGTQFVSAAAAGDDRTFVLSAEGAGSAQSPATRFYELRLDRAGRPGPLSLLRVPAVAYGDTFAVSASGTMLAVAAGTAGNGRIEVVSLATGRVRVWTSSGHGSVTSLSWAGDRWLAFGWSAASSAGDQQSGLRLLDTAAPGSDLMSSRLVVSQAVKFGSFRGLIGPLISQDGSKVFATMVAGEPANPAAEVVEFSTRTGQALGAVTPPAAESGMGQWCGALWTDPSGEHLLAVCGDFPPGGQGRIDNGHFTRMNLHVPTYNFSTPRESFIAW